MPGWISLLTLHQNPYLRHHQLYPCNVGGEPVWLELSHMQLYIGAALSRHSGSVYPDSAYSSLLNSKRIETWTTLLGLDAFALFKHVWQSSFIFSMLLGMELQITNMFGNTFTAQLRQKIRCLPAALLCSMRVIMSIFADL